MKRLATVLALACTLCTTRAAEAAPTPADPAGGKSPPRPPLGAEAHFNAGVALLQDPDGPRYEEAHSEFQMAYDLSQSPSVLGNLGLCALKLERDGEAISAYNRYLAEVSDIDPEERAQITRDLETLRVSSVHLVLTVTGRGGRAAKLVDMRVPVQGQSVRNVYAMTDAMELVTRPGHHVIVLKVDDREVDSWDITIAPGERQSHQFVVPQPKATAPRAPPPRATQPEQPKPRPIAGPVVVTTVGAVGLAVGAIFGGLTLKKVSDLEDACPGNECTGEDQPALDTAHDYVRVTDFTLLVSGVVTAAGLGWLTSVMVAPEAPVKAALGCGPHGCGLDIHGAF